VIAKVRLRAKRARPLDLHAYGVDDTTDAESGEPIEHELAISGVQMEAGFPMRTPGDLSPEMPPVIYVWVRMRVDKVEIG